MKPVEVTMSLDGKRANAWENKRNDVIRRIRLAIAALDKERGAFRQSDIAGRADIGERTLITYKQMDAEVSRIVDQALLRQVDPRQERIISAIQRIQANAKPINFKLVAEEAQMDPKIASAVIHDSQLLWRLFNAAVVSTVEPYDARIIAAAEKLRALHRPCPIQELAREAGIDPATLRSRMGRNAGVAAAVRPLTINGRILLAVAQLRGHKGMPTNAMIAEIAGIDIHTLIKHRRQDEEIRSAVEDLFAPFAAEAESRLRDVRILLAIRALIREEGIISLGNISLRAGVAKQYVRRRIWQSPMIRKAMFGVDHRIAAAIGALKQRGESLTQERIAAEAGVSPATIVYRRQVSATTSLLLRKYLPAPVPDRITDAIRQLEARKEDVILRNVAREAGLHESTVSEHRKNDTLLQKMIRLLQGGVASEFSLTEDAEQALLLRPTVLGVPAEICNTASALDQSRHKGGSRALLRACRRLGIALPKARLRAGSEVFGYNPLILLNKQLSSMEMMMEETLASLWKSAQAVDGDGSRERLIVGIRPLIKTVLAEDLHEDIEPFGRQAEMLEHLISEGDLLIIQHWGEWTGQVSFVVFMRGMLKSGLLAARREYWRQMYGRRYKEISKDAPLLGEEGHDEFTLEQTVDMAAPGPDGRDTVALLDGGLTFGEEEQILRRDTDSGVPFVLMSDKQALMMALRDMFAAEGVFSELGAGKQYRWALFTIGSLGRLGTAIKGDCDWNAVLVTDVPELLLYRIISSIAEKIGGRLHEQTNRLPTILIGKSEDYENVLRTASENGDSTLNRIVTVLRSFGIGNAKRGIASIEVVTVDSLRDSTSEGSLDNEKGRLIAQAADDGLCFDMGRNSLVTIESNGGAAKSLVNILTMQLHNCSLQDYAQMRLMFEERFLEKQRHNLERTRKRNAPVD
jgi:DNA-binding CsgD family transcriptional regulator